MIKKAGNRRNFERPYTFFRVRQWLMYCSCVRQDHHHGTSSCEDTRTQNRETEVRLVLDELKFKTKGCDLQLHDRLSHLVSPIS